MRGFVKILSCFLIFNTFVRAQTHSEAVEKVAISFKTFEYSEVIRMADSILIGDSLLTSSDLIEIYRMKALSHFSLGEEVYAKNCFYEILKIDPRFKLDPVQNSPKIISFFNQIKLDYLQNQITSKDSPPFEDNNKVLNTTFALYPQKSMKSAMIKSLLFPGWGHLYLGKKKPGIVLIMGSIVTFPSMIYYIFDSSQKEKDYLNETNLDAIQNKYDAYNQSYKIRNGLITGYTLIWLYSQWNLFSAEGDNKQLTFLPVLFENNMGQATWTVQFKYRF